MKAKRLPFLLTVFILIVHQQVSAQSSYQTAGTILLRTPYKQQSEFYKWYFDSAFYEQTRKDRSFECLRLTYTSDTAQVEAWLYKPVLTSGRRMPVIIYNRGGMGNFGNLEETELVNFRRLALGGYLVLATKTRFCGDMGKWDEHGGTDVNDVINLKAVINELAYADTANIFMYGYSRGGQMTYQASKRMRLNAMATVAGTADWSFRINERREFVEGWTEESDHSMDYMGFAKVFKNWQKDSMTILRERSAVLWADSINTPLLMLHSRQDTRVECEHSLRLAERLQFYHKVYSLVIYNEASHSLPFRYFDSFDQVLRWFDKHKKQPAVLNQNK